MADWHPMLATEERTPGVWTMIGPFGHEYGRVEIRRDGDRVFYRAWLDDELRPTTSLRDAATLVHRAWIATLSPGPPPGGIYPNLKGGLSRETAPRRRGGPIEARLSAV